MAHRKVGEILSIKCTCGGRIVQWECFNKEIIGEFEKRDGMYLKCGRCGLAFILFYDKTRKKIN